MGRRVADLNYVRSLLHAVARPFSPASSAELRPGSVAHPPADMPRLPQPPGETGLAKMGGLVMESYESLMKGGAHGPVVVPGKGMESRIILMLEGRLQPRMPFNGVPLSAGEIETIRRWIDAGAKGPAPNEVLPSAPEVSIPDLRPQVPVVSPIGSVKFSPDGQLLAVGRYREVRLVDARTGKAVATFPEHADLVRSLAFDASGKWLAAAGGRPLVAGEVKLWDLQT